MYSMKISSSKMDTDNVKDTFYNMTHKYLYYLTDIQSINDPVCKMPYHSEKTAELSFPSLDLTGSHCNLSRQSR